MAHITQRKYPYRKLHKYLSCIIIDENFLIWAQPTTLLKIEPVLWQVQFYGEN